MNVKFNLRGDIHKISGIRITMLDSNKDRSAKTKGFWEDNAKERSVAEEINLLKNAETNTEEQNTAVDRGRVRRKQQLSEGIKCHEEILIGKDRLRIEDVRRKPSRIWIYTIICGR